MYGRHTAVAGSQCTRSDRVSMTCLPAFCFVLFCFVIFVRFCSGLIVVGVVCTWYVVLLFEYSMLILCVFFGVGTDAVYFRCIESGYGIMGIWLISAFLCYLNVILMLLCCCEVWSSAIMTKSELAMRCHRRSTEALSYCSVDIPGGRTTILDCAALFAPTIYDGPVRARRQPVHA